MPSADLHRAVQLLETIEVEVLLSPVRAESGQQRVLIDVIGRQCLRGGEDARAHFGISSGSVKRTSRRPSTSSRSGIRNEFCTGQQAL